MRTFLSKISYFAAVPITTVLLLSGTLKSQTSVTFSNTGAAQSFTVPSCVTSLTITARGAAGGASGYTGGPGAAVRGVITVTSGQVYQIYVGSQGSVTSGGYNGGGVGGTSSTSNGAGGGGGSDVRFGGNALSNRILVAAGGGGSGGSTSYNATGGIGGGGSACTSPFGVGGGGGGGCAIGSAGGCAGGTATSYGSGGGGAGLSSGGSGGGSPSSTTGGYGCIGTLGAGGAGGGTSFICGGATGGVNGGGGGGGGYYGGGGGMTGTGGCNGGGGGGSSYADNNLFSAVTFSSGTETGQGSVLIQYTPIGTSVTAVASPTSICNGNSANLTAANVVTYTWLPSGSFSGSNSNAITVSPTSNQSYTVLGTNSNACVSQVVLTVTVSPGLPSLTVNSSTNSICLGKTVTLTASGALTYTWTGGVTNGVSFAPSTTSSYTVTGGNGCGTVTSVTSVSVSALPVTTMATPSLICSGSTATLMAGSSVPGYTWQPLSIVGQSVIVSPLSNTIFTVTASDGTCSGTGTVAINTNPVPTIGLVYTSSMVCEGNPVTLTASGGNSYTWTPGNLSGTSVTVNPLSPTLYSVTGNNSFSCTAGNNQVVLVNPIPVLGIVLSKTMVCVGGSVSLTASGANTYSWNTGSQTNVNIQNPTSTTMYSVLGTFTNTQCFSTNTVNVVVFAPQITVSSPTSICVGSSATLTASGGNPGGYAWSNGLNFQTIVVTPTVQTTYICTAPSTSNNLTCSSSASTQVSLNPLPIINVAATKTVMCRKDAGAVLTATGGLTYVWSTGAITNTISASSAVATTSNYVVTGTNANGCVNTYTIAIKVNVCQSINEWENAANNFIVYPNPSNGNFEVKSESELQLKLINELGQVIQLIELTSQTNYSAKLNDVSAGIYFLVGQNKNGHVKQKVIVSK